MATETSAHHHQRSWPAVVGWGSLAIFTVVFVWLISTQLGENWAKRESEAVKIVKDFRPDGGDTLSDLTKAFSLRAKDQGQYVGEFTWDAKQRDGSEYEVTLLWKEGESHHVGIWRVDLANKEIRPQGDEAASLPKRAKGS
jgi:hypothetical protein